jgi:hypothetical protein
MTFTPFARYVVSFYSARTGVYKFNCTDTTIRMACWLVYEHAIRDGAEFDGGTFDREDVRTVLESVGYSEIATLPIPA